MMNLRKSWVNVPLLKNIIKRNLFPAKVSLIIYAGFFVLTTIAEQLKPFCVFIFSFSAVILTTIYPCIIQNYAINKTKSSIIHSLPLRSKCIWFTHYLAGYLIVLVTLLIEGIGVILIDVISQYYSIIASMAVGRFILMIFVLLFIYYTLTFFVCSMAGNRLGQVVFSLAGYTLPIIIVFAFQYISNYLVPGTVSTFEDYHLFLALPLAAGLDYISIGNPFILFHVVISLLLLGGSYYIYKNRSDEYIGEPLVYRKISVALNASIILVVTLCIFYLILCCGIMDINYGIKGISILLGIYLVIGIIIAIFIEMIFKGNHIYKKLLIYIPILLIFFGINYLFANNQYNRQIEESLAQAGLEGELYINSSDEIGNFVRIEFDSEETKDFVKYLDKHRDSLYAYDKIRNGFTRETVSFSMNIIVKDIDDEGFQYPNTLRYYLDEKIVTKYLNQLEPVKRASLLTTNPKIIDQTYINCYFNQQYLYLLPDEINTLVQMNFQQIKPSDLFEGKVIDLTGADGKSYILMTNQQIIKFLDNPELIKRADFINDCNNYIYDDHFVDDMNNNENIIKELLNLEQFDNIYCEEEKLISFDNSSACYQVDLSVVNEFDSVNCEVEVELIKVDNQIKIKSIGEKEVK